MNSLSAEALAALKQLAVDTGKASADDDAFNGANLGAIQSMFRSANADDSSDEDNESDSDDTAPDFSDWETHIFAFGDVEVKAVQAPSAFNGTGADESGTVIWGASLYLSQWLSHNRQYIKQKHVIELGCGCGIASVFAALLGAQSVLATDYVRKVLTQTQHHISLNELDNMSVDVVDWYAVLSGEAKAPIQADLLMASDVIYGSSNVEPLMATIDACTKPSGIVVIATRDGRMGVTDFVALMKAHVGYKEITVCEFAKESDNVPQLLDRDDCRQRWDSSHTVYVYQKQEIIEQGADFPAAVAEAHL